mmetsp:Transcript_33007/g.79858  ORF Transcript_33007/g.79858 Transcript_33007/m.79858 type:complete len:273 (-) Transcript_33007:4-822(-)
MENKRFLIICRPLLASHALDPTRRIIQPLDHLTNHEFLSLGNLHPYFFLLPVRLPARLDVKVVLQANIPRRLEQQRLLTRQKVRIQPILPQEPLPQPIILTVMYDVRELVLLLLRRREFAYLVLAQRVDERPPLPAPDVRGRYHEGFREGVRQPQVRGREGPPEHLPQQVLVHVVHAGHELAPRGDDGVHIPSGGHVRRPPRVVVALLFGSGAQPRRVGVVREDVFEVDAAEGTVPESVEGRPRLAVHDLSDLGGTLLGPVYDDVGFREVVR